MDNFDIIGVLSDYAAAQGWKFIWQYDEFYSNITATQEHDDNLILVAEFTFTPTNRGATTTGINYNGVLMLGRKFDKPQLNDTVSSLDENQMQKYERRLKDLAVILNNTIKTVACDNDLEIINAGNFSYLFNKYDANIDFVVAENINLSQ